MRVDQIANLPALQSWTSLLSAPAATQSTSNQSLFGPPAQVDIGQTGFTAVGFRDYTQLATSGVWQFDLQSTLTPSTTGMPQTARSEKQQKADEARLTQALGYLDQGRKEEARELLNHLLSENKMNAAATQALGHVELAEGRYEQAQQLYMKAHALDPSAGYDRDAQNARILQGDDASVLRTATAMLRAPDRREEGIRLLLTLTERNPELVEARIALGDALLNSGDGNNGLMQYSLAITYADAAQLDGVAQRLEALVRESPQSAFVRQLLGRAQVRQGRYEEAIETLTAAANLAEDKTLYNKELAKAYLGLGRQRLEQGDIAGGLTSLERARELSPSDRDVKAGLAEGYLRRAEKLAASGNASAALKDYRRVADLLGSTGNKRLRTTAAQSVYRLGLTLQRRRQAAGEEIDSEALAFQAAHDLDPNNTTYKRTLAETRNALGAQYAAAGELKNAAYAYQRAWQLFRYDRTYRDNTINAFVAYADDRLANLNYTDAIQMYLEAFRVDTTNATVRAKLAAAYYARGLDYQSQNDLRNAARDFRAALRLMPDNPDYQASYNAVSAWDT